MTQRIIIPWTVAELQRLRRAWATADSRAELLKAFPGRSYGSVAKMAQAMKFRRLCKRRDWNRITAEHKPAFNFMTGVIR